MGSVQNSAAAVPTLKSERGVRVNEVADGFLLSLEFRLFEFTDFLYKLRERCMGLAMLHELRRGLKAPVSRDATARIGARIQTMHEKNTIVYLETLSWWRGLQTCTVTLAKGATTKLMELFSLAISESEFALAILGPSPSPSKTKEGHALAQPRPSWTTGARRRTGRGGSGRRTT